MKNISTILVAFILAATMVAVSGMAYLQLGSLLLLEGKKVRTQAVESCFRAAQVETTETQDNGKRILKITEPVREVYKYCLKDKGLEVSPL